MPVTESRTRWEEEKRMVFSSTFPAPKQERPGAQFWVFCSFISTVTNFVKIKSVQTVIAIQFYSFSG